MNRRGLFKALAGLAAAGAVAKVVPAEASPLDWRGNPSTVAAMDAGFKFGAFRPDAGDAQKAFNYWRSSSLKMIALEPRTDTGFERFGTYLLNTDEVDGFTVYNIH